ncbi:hypothetical protein ACIBKZ_22405 [Streptomyces sp. NPDC050421]|uniref:hypothetical protein n=1 Tax=Streptomyces sp. NPDC050421 TaxID=3365613 RepID=UPI0037AE160C
MTADLTAYERLFLTFALELAADEMACRSNEFDAADEAALESLRALAAEPDPTTGPVDTLSAVRTALQADDIPRVRRLVTDHYADERGAV